MCDVSMSYIVNTPSLCINADLKHFMQNYQKNLKRALLTDNTIMLWNDGYVTCLLNSGHKACLSMLDYTDGYV